MAEEREPTPEPEQPAAETPEAAPSQVITRWWPDTRRLVGNDFPPLPKPVVDPRILATPRRDPFAGVYIPTPMAPPRVGPPNYRIPATAEDAH